MMSRGLEGTERRSAGREVEKGASMTHKGPRPGRRLANLHRQIEASGDTRPLAFAKWLIDHADRSELPQVISWIEECKPRQVAEALRQTEMLSPPDAEMRDDVGVRLRKGIQP